MKRTQKPRYGVRCWYWRSEEDRNDDQRDLAIAQVEQFRECPNKGMAHYWGKKMSAHERATSPGLYDIMIAVPDRYEMDGVRWEVEEIRP